MNVRDIEETIHTLETRHPGLNEVMLLTLLKAGGWEDKDIETAKVLFRSSPSVTASIQEAVLETHSLPIVQESPVFEPIIDEEHRLEEGHTDVPVVFSTPQPSNSMEPVSLVTHSETVIKSSREELPHNLPLRPFETSEHIWPFARYRDVFYGEETTSLPPRQPLVSTSRSVSYTQATVVQPHVTVNVHTEQQKREPNAPPSPPSPVYRPPEPVQVAQPEPFPVEKRVVIVEKAGDEKLVILACVMLLAILLLLGYMYSNGRL